VVLAPKKAEKDTEKSWVRSSLVEFQQAPLWPPTAVVKVTAVPDPVESPTKIQLGQVCAFTGEQAKKTTDKNVAVFKMDIFLIWKKEQNDFRDFEVKTSKSEKRKPELKIFLNLFFMATQLQKVSRDVERV